MHKQEIVLTDQHSTPTETPLEQRTDRQAVAPSDAPPYPVETIFPPGGEEPPPEFTVYEPECFEAFSGNVVSHDKHLNEDGRGHFYYYYFQLTCC